MNVLFEIKCIYIDHETKIYKNTKEEHEKK